MSIVAYEQFVEDHIATTLDIDRTHDDFGSYILDCGDNLRSDYGQYVVTSDSKAIVTPIRYDYKALDYKAGIHPASHIHFGFDNHIRVGTCRIMNPISFTFFIIRQRYPQKWLRLIEKYDAGSLRNNVRESLQAIHQKYHGVEDQFEIGMQ